ncbi:hypothetical protein IFM89_018002 [Coptis chinensis]|uniref:PROP1-like PPR domain-containing protein n=1 Tax=Coptis chinensis TaxID=261450 RepID=A0A835HVT0_9MAGN|nr:hypothetical protein IFM89_018002 [Coptis chinensis]
MRGKLIEVYPKCDKESINGMLLIIAEKVVEEIERGGIEEMLGVAESTPSLDLSEDLWKTVWEVSNIVLEDMKKEEKKEKMKKFIQSEEVKEMCKFASEVGVRGNMLREMRFKWAKEKMEEAEFYETLELKRDEEREGIVEEEEMNEGEVNEYGAEDEVAEMILEEDSFEANIRDYSKLIDAHAKDQRTDDAERILEKMIGKGVQPDILTSTILVDMYSAVGNADRAKEEFARLRRQGFQPDMKAYNSMIMAYVNSGQPKCGESLKCEMEARDIKPTKEIYMALLRSFSERGLVDGAQRIATTMQFAGFQPTLESCTLLVEAYAQAGNSDQARANFDYMRKVGHSPDDRCTAVVISVYEKKNLLDQALDLLLQLKKDGFEPGVETYTVLVDWFAKLQLVDEAEELLEKTIVNGQTPPLKAQVSLCDMYARSRNEKKALQALGIVEGKKDLLSVDDFERIIKGLIEGELVPEALRVHKLMEARGFTASEPLKVKLMSSRATRYQQNSRLGTSAFGFKSHQ